MRLTGFKLGLLLTLAFCFLKLMHSVEALGGSEALRFLQNIENSVLDLKFQLRGGPRTERELKAFQERAHVVIAAIDERSTRMEDLGLFPWPRAKIATLIERLNHCGAKVIGFDVVFAEPDASRVTPVVQAIRERYASLEGADEGFARFLERTHAEVHGDAELARVLEASDNVVLGYFFFTNADEVRGLDQQEILAGIEDISFGTIGFQVADPRVVLELVFPRALGVRANLPMFTDAVELFGLFNQLPDRDRIYRRVPMLYVYRQSCGKGLAEVFCELRQRLFAREEQPVSVFPSLSLQVLSAYYGHPVSLYVDRLPDKTHIPDYTGLFIGPLGPPGDEHIEIPLETTVQNRGRFRLNFYGPKQTFRHVSAGDLIHGEPDACRTVTDKVVLVGATTMGIYDLRPTPFDHSFPGVEIHATVIENVIRQDYLVRPQGFDVLEAGFMLVLGLFLSWVLTRFRLTLGLGVTLLGLVLVSVADYFWLFCSGIWAHVVLLDMHLFSLFLGIAVYRYATEERQKRETRRAFQFYLSKEVIDTLLQDTAKLKLGGERRELTVLFSDIRGFTTISEGLAPDELTALLNEYLTPMTEVVFRHRGTLDKYMGDAIMAFFGAPVAFADHPRAACRTALGMMDELTRLRVGWRQRGLPELDIGIGVNTGNMSVGNMGSVNRFDYTVMGDQVNLGSRLEGLNKQYGTHIIISEFTCEAIGDHFTCRELDFVAVKGRQEPVRIYELIHRGPPVSGQDAWIDDFARALAAYRSQRWDEAQAGFDELVKSRGDLPAEMFIERCREMRSNPPGEDWDGVFKMMTK